MAGNEKYLNTRIKHKKDSLVNWSSANPILLDGELALVTDGTSVTQIRVGDGTSAFNSLPNIISTSSGLPSQTEHSGEFLTTDGTSAYWTSIPSVPTPQIADENKLLSVNSSGQYVLVTIVNSENVAY